MFKVFLFLWGVTLSTMGLGGNFYKSFMPENNLHLEDNLDNYDSNIDETVFNQIIAKAKAFYGPVVEAHGGQLVISGNWGSSTVNAYASRTGDTWNVFMLGGLARRSEVTPDGFALVICHELGHHLAGFPFVSNWASNEGNSDYFSTLSCARELWRYDFLDNYKFREKITPYPEKLCDSQWKAPVDRDLCYRSMVAGKSLADLLASLGRSGKVDFQTPDLSEVSSTNHRHPAAQCRLDTYMVGSLCDVVFDKHTIPINESEANRQSCIYKNSRPRCWYKPSF